MTLTADHHAVTHPTTSLVLPPVTGRRTIGGYAGRVTLVELGPLHPYGAGAAAYPTLQAFLHPAR